MGRGPAGGCGYCLATCLGTEMSKNLWCPSMFKQHVQAAIVAEVTTVQHENAAVASGNLDLTAVDVGFSGKGVVRTNEN